MEGTQVLELMRRYFVDKAPAEQLEQFGDLTPQNLLKESLDMVDFIVYLEEELGKEVDVSQLSDALMNQNFRVLADQIAAHVAAPA